MTTDASFCQKINYDEVYRMMDRLGQGVPLERNGKAVTHAHFSPLELFVIAEQCQKYSMAASDVMQYIRWSDDEGPSMFYWTARFIQSLVERSGVFASRVTYEASGPQSRDLGYRAHAKHKDGSSVTSDWIYMSKIPPDRFSRNPRWASDPDGCLRDCALRNLVSQHAPGVLLGVMTYDDILDRKADIAVESAALKQATTPSAQEAPAAPAAPATSAAPTKKGGRRKKQDKAVQAVPNAEQSKTDDTSPPEQGEATSALTSDQGEAASAAAPTPEQGETATAPPSEQGEIPAAQTAQQSEGAEAAPPEQSEAAAEAARQVKGVESAHSEQGKPSGPRRAPIAPQRAVGTVARTDGPRRLPPPPIPVNL